MDVEPDIDALKKRREIEKLEVDIRNARASIGLERLKAWGSLLGPVMTAVTVLGTVFIGYMQITAKSSSDEDANWRQTIAAIDDIKPDELASKHVGTLLKPFLESPRYRQLAVGVAVSELPRVRDVGTFRDLFANTFPEPASSDLPVILDVARKLTATDLALQNAQSKADAGKSGASAHADASQIQDQRDIVRGELAALCDGIATGLRQLDHARISKLFRTGQAPATIRLDTIYFEQCDFSGVDFTDADLDHSTFDNVKLDGATFGNVGRLSAGSPYLWAYEIWWRARSIDPDLLRSLIAHFKPYQPPSADWPKLAYRDGTVIAPSEWITDVRRLCDAAHIECPDADLTAPFPKQ